MYIYTLSPYEGNEQLLKKYCLQLDSMITAVQHFIDFKNPNYLLLNYHNPPFYTNEQLADNNVHIIDRNGTQVTHIYTTNMYPGFILYHNFGQDDIPIDSGTEKLSPGNALIKTSSGFYSIPLDAQGDFYVLNRFSFTTDTVSIQYQLASKGTVDYGTNYFFSLLTHNARFIYKDFHRRYWESFKINAWTYNTNHEFTPVICTKHDSLWTDNLVLSYEILTDDYEEVYCDSTHDFGSQAFEKQSQPFYTINTDLENTLASNFSLYLY